jgi:hypothetical protein
MVYISAVSIHWWCCDIWKQPILLAAQNEHVRAESVQKFAVSPRFSD